MYTMKDCTIYKTVDLVGKRWTLLVLLEIYRGQKLRFNELKGKMDGITQKVLSQRLKELEDNGLINKKIDSKSIPIKTEYSLTEQGKDFVPIIKYIKKWGLKWNFENEECKNTQCKNCSL